MTQRQKLTVINTAAKGEATTESNRNDLNANVNNATDMQNFVSGREAAVTATSSLLEELSSSKATNYCRGAWIRGSCLQARRYGFVRVAAKSGAWQSECVA